MITNVDIPLLKKSITPVFDEIKNKVDSVLQLYKEYETRALNAEWTERAISHFGTTDKPHEAGFILYDGQMLDFSGGYKETRQIDHSEIYQIYTDEELEEANKKYRYGGIIQLFQIQSNALRISVDRYGEYIYLSMHDVQTITKSQIETLKYIENYDTERHTLFDVYDKDGHSVKHGEVSSVSELISVLKEFTENSIDYDLKTKLSNAEIQIDKILQNYDKLSKNEMDVEEKYKFSNYLINLFEKADKLANVRTSFTVNIEKIKNSIKLMKSSDVSDKVIGIDNFISLTHTNAALLSDLVAIVNRVAYIYGRGYDYNDEGIYDLFKWREKVNIKIVNELNEIRTIKGLSRFRYEDM